MLVIEFFLSLVQSQNLDELVLLIDTLYSSIRVSRGIIFNLKH